MSPGAVFERVYLALREELGRGRFPPGESLEPARLAVELDSSITPVRDALHRLAGERLVQAPRHDGFRVPLLSEAALRDLYGWAGELLLLAARRARVSAAAELADPARPLDLRTEALWNALAARTGSAEHRICVERALRRLSPFRAAEPRVLSGLERELELLVEAESSGDMAALAKLVRAYHRRRIAAAPQILAELPPAF